MEDFVSRREHEEFEKRMKEANDRQDKRIGILEGDVKELRNISASIQSLAVEMKGMREEQTKQGERLEALEGKDGKKYQRVIDIVVTAVITALIAFVLTQIGL